MSTRGFAVVDVETTGLFPGGSDRVIELAVVTTDEFGSVTGEWETVVNPRRHIGAGHVHGLDGATLMNAPAFADILPDLVDVLDGRAIVAAPKGPCDAGMRCCQKQSPPGISGDTRLNRAPTSLG